MSNPTGNNGSKWRTLSVVPEGKRKRNQALNDEQAKRRETRLAVDLLADARNLGDELLEIWED